MSRFSTTMIPGLTIYAGAGERTRARTFYDLDFLSSLDEPLMGLYRRLLFAKRSSLMRADEVDFPARVGPELLGTSQRLRVDDDNPEIEPFQIPRLPTDRSPS